MTYIRNLASSSNLLFAGTVLSGLFIPQGATVTFFLILPALVLILTVTVLRFPPGFFRSPKTLLPGALLGNLMNYIILGNLIILGSSFFIRDEKFWIGLILIAAVPPAVAILALGDQLRANRLLTLAGFAGVHVAALILIPLIGLAFLKYIPMSYDKLIVLFLSLVGLPLLFSRIAVDRDWAPLIEHHEGMIIKVCYVVIFYTLAARNAPLIRQWPVDIFLIALIAILSILFISAALWFLHKFYKLPRETFLALLLMGTTKNYGLAGGVALYVFGSEAALPALIFSVCMFVLLAGLKGMMRKAALPPPEASAFSASRHNDTPNHPTNI